MAEAGAFTFVLHSHIPYVRQAGRWPHGEEWIHEAAVETYIPLLEQLKLLKERGVRHALTLGLTPILVEQLADEDVRRNLLLYLDEKIKAASGDIPRFQRSGETQLETLAEYYLGYFKHQRNLFVDTFHGDLIPAFRAFQEDQVIEIMTCAATHGYLPLLGRDESIQLQLRTAVDSYQRHFGCQPKAIWLPECAYRPGYVDDQGVERPGIEHFLARHGLKLFFSETHLVEGGRPVGVAAGEAIGPYGAVTRRYMVPFDEQNLAEPGTTFMPYHVVIPEVSVIGRNNRTGLQVWSADWGYPGDYDYREFHKKDGVSGLQYWRVTGARIDLGQKDLYHPDWAAYKVGQHADHFAWLISDEVKSFASSTGRYGIVSANFDTELFGHWWLEGIEWLGRVVDRVADSDVVELTTASKYLQEYPPDTVMNLPEGSWGAGGTHFVWMNADTQWMWPMIHEAEDTLAASINTVRVESEAYDSVLRQAARELLLLQSSDWPFLVTTGQAKEYAVERFRSHYERFRRLIDSLETGPDMALRDELWEKDKIFPHIQSGWYSK
jgi:1,4-alpha-glucan branching enzyme